MLRYHNSNAVYEEAEEEMDNFIKAVREYEETVPSKFKGQINFENTHTWQDFLDQVDSATQTYKNDGGKGHWKKVRKSFWKFGRNNTAFDSWLGLLPTQFNYVSVLCGGFKLILMVSHIVILILKLD